MGEPTPEIIWTFNGKRVEEMGSRFLLLSLKTHLVITSVQKGDNGILTCQAKNIGGMDSKSLNLKVTCEYASLRKDFLETDNSIIQFVYDLSSSVVCHRTVAVRGMTQPLVDDNDFDCFKN